MKLEIRSEHASDVQAVDAVVAAAFESRVEAELVVALRRSADPQLSLVAESEGQVVGHVFFSPVGIESGPPGLAAAQLAPLAVAPAHQRTGIGGALVREGLARCRAIGWSAVFLVGDPDYYGRFGFRSAGPSGFSQPGAHDRFLQLVELVPGALSEASGRIALHPAFDEVGAE